MKIVLPILAALMAGAMLLAADGTSPQLPERPKAESLAPRVEKIRPLHARLGEPQPGDWLTQHKEPGQTFAEYLKLCAVMPTPQRRTIYIQPIGEFAQSQRKVVTLAADFIGRFYGLPVKTAKDLPLTLIPDKAKRVHPQWGDKQILTGYVLNDVLRPRLPADAFAYIALTASDLWPGEGWNFVFGQASLSGRVGVWSIYRYGDPGAGEQAFGRCLSRTMKVSVHELGHMFTMLHCTAYECGMCGSNNMAESDRRPTEFCPECVAKVWYATGVDPARRYVSLARFCRDNKLDEDAKQYERLAEALGASVPGPTTTRAE